MWSFILFKSQPFFLYFYDEWEYIMEFTQVLIMHQIYHTISTSLPFSSSLPFHDFWSSFNRYHFSIYTCVHNFYTVFTLLPPFTKGIIIYEIFYDISIWCVQSLLSQSMLYYIVCKLLLKIKFHKILEFLQSNS
jgi:hypothetical protein